jgi:hypothetical protein
LGIYAREKQSATIGDKAYDVNPLSLFDKELLSKADWVYVGIPSTAVPDTLKLLSGLPIKNVGLLIDTPVLPWRQTLARRYFKHFRETVVLEDIVYLPWIQSAQKAAGSISRIILDRSAYRYHGIALVKTLINCSKFKSARLQRKEGMTVVELKTADSSISIIEPRDYAHGHMTITGSSLIVTDNSSDKNCNIYPTISHGRCFGLSIANEQILFSPVETELMGLVPEDATLTSLTHELKRVGLLRICNDIGEGKKAGRSIEDALSDTRLDELVHHLGKWINVA